MNDATSRLCGCGNPARYMVKHGDSYAHACNKIARCPTWNELKAKIDNPWQPIETMPKSGEFLIGVWEGEWKEPRQSFKVYEATGFNSGPVWGRQYRTAEGESYEVVGWMNKPLPPEIKS